MDTIWMTATAFQTLADTVGTLPPESGAVIGAENDHPALISQVWFDEQAGSGNRFYKPSCRGMEETVLQWQQKGYHFSGIVHSHTEGYPSLSPMDLRSGELFMQVNHMPCILLGLFHGGTLSMFRLSVAPEGQRPELTPLSVTVISAD